MIFHLIGPSPLQQEFTGVVVYARDDLYDGEESGGVLRM